jgi:bifunctional non-homologous end joining protein LigD
VGTGFTHADLADLQKLLAPWKRTSPPITAIPREHARGVCWVEPVHVGEVAYRTWTLNRTTASLKTLQPRQRDH